MTTNDKRRPAVVRSAKDAVAKLAAEKWRSSGLTDADAKKLGLRALSGAEVAKLGDNFSERGALRLPYFDEGGKPTKFFRVRYLEEPTGFAAAVKKPQRYAQPAKTLNEVYLPPLMEKPWADVLSNPSTTLYITEGELKAACATRHGFPTIGLGGVDVWRSAKNHLPILQQLDKVVWTGREVVIIFDSDAATNPDVTRAQRQLAKALLERGAKPSIASLPGGAGGKKQGLDDFLVARGPDALREVLEQNTEPLDSAQALWEMNEKVVFIRDPGLVIERATGQRMSTKTFKESVYANHIHVEYSGEKPKRVSTAKRWIEWRQRFEAQEVTYAPGKPQVVDGNWNLWRGWGVEPARGDIGPWTRLLDFIFKDESAEVRNWFERWCAYPLQHPGTKLFTSVAMWGVQHGTGKTLIGYTLRDIYGANGLEIKNHQLTGNHNEWAVNRQFIIGDEITGSDKRVDADRLKGLITQEEILINMKYVPTFRLPDCLNYYFTSNAPDAFFLDDTDRRFFVHEVKGPPAHRSLYEEYDRWRKHDGGVAHLFHHLLNLPLGDFNPKAPALETRAKRAMIDDVKSEHAKWAKDLVTDPGAVLNEVASRWPGVLSQQAAKNCDLFTPDQLKRFFTLAAPDTRVTENGLGRELTRAGVPRLEPLSTRSGKKRLYVVRNAKRWEKASPAQCASHWERFFPPDTKKS